MSFTTSVKSEVAANELIEKANAAGGLDNITVIIVLNKND